MTNQELVFAVLVKEAMSRQTIKEGSAASKRQANEREKYRNARKAHEAKVNPTAAPEGGTLHAKGKVVHPARRAPKSSFGKNMDRAQRFAGKHKGKALAAGALYGAYRGGRALYRRMKAAKAAKAALAAA